MAHIMQMLLDAQDRDRELSLSHFAKNGTIIVDRSQTWRVSLQEFPPSQERRRHLHNTIVMLNALQ